MFVHHTNPGFPLLDAGTRLGIDSERTTEWREDREVGPESYSVARGPEPEARDEVFVRRLRPDANGDGRVGLINDRLALGLYRRFPVREMPLLSQWQHSQRGIYVTGIEPGNASTLGRAWNRKHGTLEYLPPGETHEFHLEIGVLHGEQEIGTFERQILSTLALETPGPARRGTNDDRGSALRLRRA